MKRKFLEDLGLEKEAIDKIMDENGKDVEAAKGDAGQTKEELKQAKEQLAERDQQLEDLKKSSGDNAELQKKIGELQAENERISQEKDEELNKFKLMTAIEKTLGDSVHDAEMVAGMLDTGKLILGDDGKVAGLDEQIKTIRESKAFLFKEASAETTVKPGFRPIGASASQDTTKLETKQGAIDMKAAIQAKIGEQNPAIN